MQGKENPLLGGFPVSRKSSFRCLNVNIGLRGYFTIIVGAFSSITVFYIAYISLTRHEEYNSTGERLPGQPPLPHQPLFVSSLQYAQDYKHGTCERLDSLFEFESPPDFTKLGIESWTDCQEVKAKKGWRVEHCTAPGSTWMNIPSGEILEDVDESNNFLFRPEPRPEGQPHLYTSPPKVQVIPLGARGQSAPSVCNPSGYFRVKRLWTPSTEYTLGSDTRAPGSQCRNNPGRPISLNDTTKDYIEDYAGPDTFRAIIDGAEHYVADQQINLGDCTYALPYVLSRPGRFWLVQIEHGYEDFRGLNENYDDKFRPEFNGEMILPEVESAPPKGTSEYQKYERAAAQVHEFGVCSGCQQFLQPHLTQKYEDWPACSRAPLVGAREYGVLTRQSPVQSYEDLFNHDLEWVGSRPLCRHEPRLVSFDTPEAIPKPNSTSKRVRRPYGSPPEIPNNLEEERKITTDCLSRKRSLYVAGDSHGRFLYVSTLSRVAGQDSASAITGWATHDNHVGGISIRQDFESFLQSLYSMAQYQLDPAYVPFQGKNQEMDYLETVDTVILDYGAWAAAGFDSGPLWTTQHYAEYAHTVLWAMAEVRHRRRELFKKTGYGHPDLTLIWMGQAPWPDTRVPPDMRTNTRLQYWDDLANAEIEEINRHYQDEGGMIDHLNIYDKFLPFRKLSPDGAHHAVKEPADAAVQVLVHKLDLCRPAFTPTFPPPPPPV